MTTPWHEDKSFWHHMAKVIFSAKRWEKAPEEIEQLLKLVPAPPGSAVLDMPCGPGRHALEFARRGYPVTGVDITQAYLDEGRQRADAEDLPIEWVNRDMRRFDRATEFDLVVNLFSSFGYFDDPDDDETLARNFLRALRPGGHLVMDLLAREVLARVFSERHWEQLDDGGLLLEERAILDHWTRSRTRWIYIRDGAQHEHSFELRVYAADQLMNLLTRVGFVDVVAYGGLSGEPYDHEAMRLVVTARKE